MTHPTSIAAVIDLWPTRKELAGELGLSPDRIHKWAQNGTIPAKFHLPVIRAAAARGYPVTADLLAELHHQPATPSEDAA